MKVDGTESAENIDWGAVNQPMDKKTFNELKDLCIDHYNKAKKAYGEYVV